MKGDYSERRFVATVTEVKKRSTSAEIIMLALMLEGNRIIDRIADALSPDEFKNSSIRDVVNAIFDLHKENKEVTPSRLINHFSESAEAATLITEAVGISEIIGDKEKALSDCIARMKKDNLKERMTMIQDAIRIAHTQKNDDRVKELVAQYNELIKIGKA